MISLMGFVLVMFLFDSGLETRDKMLETELGASSNGGTRFDPRLTRERKEMVNSVGPARPTRGHQRVTARAGPKHGPNFAGINN